MIKKLAAVAAITAITACLPLFSQAEIYEDYTPGTEVTELVVVDVKSNYVDDYLVQIKNTWVAAMEVEKSMGHVIDYGVWVTNVSDSPNVFLTATYKDMGAMQGNKERYDAVNAALKDMGMDEEKNEKTAKGYEDMREIVDYKILRKITYK
jgi:hypothetical protein